MTFPGARARSSASEERSGSVPRHRRHLYLPSDRFSVHDPEAKVRICFAHLCTNAVRMEPFSLDCGGAGVLRISKLLIWRVLVSSWFESMPGSHESDSQKQKTSTTSLR